MGITNSRIGIFLREPAIIWIEKHENRLDKYIKTLYRMGFRQIQIPEGIERVRGKDYTADEINAIKSFPGGISFHHDEFNTNLCQPNNNVREGLDLSVERASEIGAEYLVIHPGTCGDGEYETAIEHTVKNLRYLVSIAGQMEITVENNWHNLGKYGRVVGSEIEDLKQLIEEVPRLMINLDFSHLILQAYNLCPQSPEEYMEKFIDELGDCIYSTHVNDVANSKSDVHFIPGYSEFSLLLMKLLESRGYRGPHVLELGEGKQLFDENYGEDIFSIHKLAFDELSKMFIKTR